ncbi:MAG: PTS sugar transporter subunit IIB [Erysipelotrichaceae bacterium]
MKSKVNILFVCGYGVGSSAMSEIVVNKALKEINLPAEVKHTSVGELSSQLEWADIIAASKMFASGIDLSHTKDKYLIEVVNIMNGKEIAGKVLTVVKEHFPELVK